MSRQYVKRAGASQSLNAELAESRDYWMCIAAGLDNTSHWGTELLITRVPKDSCPEPELTRLHADNEQCTIRALMNEPGC